jgi:transposase-like protein
LLDSLGVQRGRKAIHDWVQKADLQPESGKPPNQIALDETVIRIDEQQFWPYTAESQSNDLFHVQMFSPTTAVPTFHRELRQRDDVETTGCLTGGATPLQTARSRAEADCRCVTTEIGTLSGESFETSNAKPRHVRTAPATSPLERPNIGCSGSLAGTLLQTNHHRVT